MKPKKILVAPLNWGLGHASRCVPIINELLKNNFEPIIASDGDSLALLQKEFPKLRSIELPSYQITYPKSGSFLWHLLKQAPHFLKTMLQEQRLVKLLVAREKLDGIISDNRFGIWHNNIPSVYITHQLNVMSGFTTFLSSFLHRSIIHKFDECWVPDTQNSELSGKLSTSKNIKIPVKRLGVLSRFKHLKTTPKYDVTVVLSGPEPQRSLLEKLLLIELAQFKGSICFVRGLPLETHTLKSIEGFTFFNFLSASDLNEVLCQSKLVIARSGYSTLMDLAVLGKKVFFIPTPGQFEQAYLAEYCQQKGLAPFCHQHEFSLHQLQKCTNYQYLKLNGTSLRPDMLDIFK